MSDRAWFSQLFDIDSGGGYLAALPYEAMAHWKAGGDYDELTEETEQFLLRPLGPTAGLFVGDFDGEGFHEAHWMRQRDEPGVTLVVWSAWDDPNRKTLPEDWKKVASAWRAHADPRQVWLEGRLQKSGLRWQRLGVQTLASGVLLLMHAEWPALKTRLARPRSIARSDTGGATPRGDAVPVGVRPGDYVIETLEIDELPEGRNLCAVCRWLPAGHGGTA